MTPTDLVAAGVKPAVVKIVLEVTRHDREQPYLDWISEIASRGNQSAIRVKLADNADNLDPHRIALLGTDSLARTRYEPARAILLGALK